MGIEEIRTDLCFRLRVRQAEIQQAVITRVYAVSDPKETADPEYLGGLKAAVSAALDYGVAALERSEDRALPTPTALLSQARLAARNRVSLDTVLRRYLAGHTLLGDFIFEEAEGAGVSATELKRLLRAQAALLDRLLATIAEEYERESGRPSSNEERRAEQIERLLAGEQIEPVGLAYDFKAWHLGVVALGAAATDAIGALAASVDCRLLEVRREGRALWAWFGSRRRLDPCALAGRADRDLPAGVSLAFGEPGKGVEGWRLTHRQAEAALPIVLSGGDVSVRYADVALLASMLNDDLLVTSLRELFLAPLARERDGGVVARDTLRAYFAAERNVSSAAAALGVSRQAVGRRLRAIEERIERPLNSCAAELEAALRLEETDPVPSLAPCGSSGVVTSPI